MWDCRCIFPSESLQASLERGNEFSLRFVGGTGFSSQFQGRGDGRKSFTDGLNFDFRSVAESTCPDPCSETGEEDGLVQWRLPGKVWGGIAEFGVGAPVLPILLLCFGSLMSDSIGNSSPRKQEITRQLSFFGTLNSVQDLFCGRG